ncbi:uncharacterized protein N7483_002453 [Penicillium malachiteum]|uniref:uncharacterized protein n=1 Tax=Penicillium malachiteum TaxID=1324776 RepID=UPI0025483F9F|nr:uncharacterized protein N7483_002453 [Penicillium malachiteum]KAJ5737328.1 hypothetical protein N7483_002453 [Penicillium malachiteum]
MIETDSPSLDPSILTLAVDACLSASNFGDKPWKLVAVEYAKVFANELDSRVIKCRIQLREAAIARLYNLESMPSTEDIKICRVDNRSNADFGRLVVLRARLQIEKRVSTEVVNQTLDQFCASNPISDLERSVQLDIDFLRAKLLRFQGEFALAKSLLVGHMQAFRYRAVNMITIHYFETLCEEGHPSKAVEALEYEYNELRKRENGQSGSGRRLTLALAGSCLMKYLLDKHSDAGSLEKSERFFTSIRWTTKQSLITKHNYYVAQASLGMIYLLKSDWEGSLCHWNRALEAARNCFSQIGHAEMVTQYAQCEILHRLGRTSEAKMRENAARNLFKEHGRGYHFLGQGTAWLDQLNMLAEEAGRPAIAV